MEEEPRVLRPRPQKPFELTPSTGSSNPPTPPTGEDSSNPDVPSAKEKDGLSSASRNESIYNLTSPALLGIYSPTALESSNTPWGTGAQTPSLRRNGSISHEGGLEEDAAKVAAALRSRSERPHVPRKHGVRGYVLPLVRRSVLLFIFGVAYGAIITQLHADPRMTPITLGSIIAFGSWQYMAFWGAAGVALGSLLPWFDGVWEDNFGGEALREKGQALGSPDNTQSTSSRSVGSLAADWNPMVRSIGAFVGIAFAIRKLPWQSTLQVSLTLALANPVLWYLLDRSKPGFILSSAVGLTGMVALLNINPEIVPSPAAATQSPLASSAPGEGASAAQGGILQSGISHESIAVGTWIASVLFCSCVCFGNIGRRLAS